MTRQRCQLSATEIGFHHNVQRIARCTVRHFAVAHPFDNLRCMTSNGHRSASPARTRTDSAPLLLHFTRR
ncbi:hypothetical protein [Burkholderia sp. BCC1977]|uniref:hypothetical protein n=1 Tax=Burkholderia sp. BCC1977 TaxID=2817440 RepID=UPI002ABDFE13|nr:hypothetical protein [Burkholderia sp. BCC1977]